MTSRIQKLIAAAGYCSRRQAEVLITDGRVSVNGKTVTLGETADSETDIICIDGLPLQSSSDFVYIMLNKPRGYVTTLRDEKGRKTVSDLVHLPERIYPVGRLDMFSEGLLLLTNDGELTNKLIHPAHNVDKIYHVTVQRYTPEKAEQMSQPMRIDGYLIKPATIDILKQSGDTALLEITIHEGRNRQIRKMAAQCDLKISKLKRVQEGPLKLGNLNVGAWRYLTQEEIAKIQSYVEF